MRLNSAFGSSRITSSAYQKWSTKDCNISTRQHNKSRLHYQKHSVRKCSAIAYSKFENKLRKVFPNTSSHLLYQTKLFTGYKILFSLSYSGENFNVNQLPNISISLSPLNSNQTNDLHVSIASNLHQNFS